MKTITLYKYAELSRESQEKAFKLCQSEKEKDLNIYGLSWSEEIKNSVKAFADMFALEWSFSIGEYPEVNFKFKKRDSDYRDMSGVRRMKYLNQFHEQIFKGKYYSSGKYVDGKYSYKKRNSKVLFVSECPLTGVYYDDILLKPIIDAMRGKYLKEDFSSIIQDCALALIKALESEWNYVISRDAFLESSECSGWHWNEDGELIER